MRVFCLMSLIVSLSAPHHPPLKHVLSRWDRTVEDSECCEFAPHWTSVDSPVRWLWLFESFRRGVGRTGSFSADTNKNQTRHSAAFMFYFSSNIKELAGPYAGPHFLADDITVPQPGGLPALFASFATALEFRSGQPTAVPVFPLPQSDGRWWVAGWPVTGWLQWWRWGSHHKLLLSVWHQVRFHGSFLQNGNGQFLVAGFSIQSCKVRKPYVCFCLIN